jgi:LysM repeat protein
MSPRIQFDFSSIDPRRRAVIIGGIVVIFLAVVGLVILRPKGDQTAEVTPLPTFTLPASATASPSGPLTETPTQGPTPTLEPYQYTVQSGDTLLFIIQQFGYRDTSIVPELLALNNLPNADSLVAGQTLLVPRQTPTVGPTFTATATLDPLITPTATGTPGPTIDPNITVTYEGCSPQQRCTSPDGKYWIHLVKAGDTIASIAVAYNSTVTCLLRENALSANSPIFEGQQIKVCILVTLTPTLTPTGGPNSTATPTPTPSAPILLAPASNAKIPRNQSVNLQWTTIRPLSEGQYYLVVLQNLSTNEENRYTTRTNAYRLPDSLKRGQYQWRVVIVNGDNTNAPLVSGTGEFHTFTWGQ